MCPQAVSVFIALVADKLTETEPAGGTSYCAAVTWPGLAPACAPRPLHRPAGRGCPAATHFSLLRQRKVSKRKATRSLGPLRCATGQPAVLEPSGVSLNSLRSDNASPDPLVSALLGPARTGKSGIPNSRRQNPIPKTTRTRHGVSLFVFVCGIGIWVFRVPLCMRRGAQVQADQGSRCLSGVKRSEFSETPPEPSTTGCP